LNTTNDLLMQRLQLGNDMSKIELELYAVRNKSGSWFRAKGFGGGGASWVDDISKAKIYPKIGQARNRVTFFATNYAAFGVPEIVKLKVTEFEVLDETKRVAKAIKNKEQKQARYIAASLKRKRDAAERELKAAQERLDKLKRS
jgi:hypothetical protein